MLIEDKTIIITGAGGGLGEGIARVCYREGAQLTIADINGSAAASVAGSLGERAFAIACDVRRDGDLAWLVEETMARFGRIDGLVNNAGVNFAKPFLETTAEEWDRVISVDLRAVFFLTQLVCRGMLQQSPPGGSIVNIASVEGIEGFLGGSSYNASKGGVVLLTKNMAIDYARAGVRVNVICPGFIDTPMFRSVFSLEATKAMQERIREAHQLGRFGKPVEIANAALFLASDEASFVTGVTLPVDGGYTAGHRFTG